MEFAVYSWKCAEHVLNLSVSTQSLNWCPERISTKKLNYYISIDLKLLPPLLVPKTSFRRPRSDHDAHGLHTGLLWIDSPGLLDS